MKRNFLVISLAMAALSLPCLAQTHTAVFRIPFAFQTATNLLPAGEYSLTILGDIASLQSIADQKRVQILTVQNRPPNDEPLKAHLHFMVAGGTYYLHYLEGADHQGHLSMPKPVEHLMARGKNGVTSYTLSSN